MWECPDLFSVGDRHAMIYSTQGKVHWMVGDLDAKEMVFYPEHHGILDYGSFYAAKTQLDAGGNRILWGWVPETRPEAEYRAAGWAGMMSLPRVLTVGSDGQLAVEVSPAMKVLRGTQETLKITASEENTRRQIEQMKIANCCGEILCSFQTNAGTVALSLLGSQPGRAEKGPWIDLRYDPAFPDRVGIDDQVVPIGVHASNALEVHMFVDGSVVELFINKQVAYTKRHYYAGMQAPAMSIKFTGEITALSGLSMWQLTPISGDRLTT
jgi:beta-fructofuranosidase